MNLFRQFDLRAQALLEHVENNKKFFSSIQYYVRHLASFASAKAGPPTKEELRVVMGKIEGFFRQWRPSGSTLYFPPSEASDLDPTVRELNRIIGELTAMDDEDYKEITPQSVGLPSKRPSTRVQTCVFIGHGRSKLWARLNMFFNEINVDTVTYESEPRTGESIVPILEKMLEQATFAVLILTAEDEVAEERKRARQNVVHEAGLFQGRLGFKRAVLLVQEGVETFTNVDGLQHIRFSGDNVEQTFYELERVLKREGQIIE